MVAVGGTFGLLVTTKLSALPIALAILALAWMVSGWRRRVEFAAIGFGSAFLVCGWYLIQNTVRYGDPLARSASARYLPSSAASEQHLDNRTEWRTHSISCCVEVPNRIVTSFWYQSGWNQFRWSLPVNLVITAVFAAALLGLVRRKISRPDPCHTLEHLHLLTPVRLDRCLSDSHLRGALCLRRAGRDRRAGGIGSRTMEGGCSISHSIGWPGRNGGGHSPRHPVRPLDVRPPSFRPQNRSTSCSCYGPSAGALRQLLLHVLQCLQAVLGAEVLRGGDPDQARFEWIQSTAGEGIDDVVGALFVSETGARELPVRHERLVGVVRKRARDLCATEPGTPRPAEAACSDLRSRESPRPELRPVTAGRDVVFGLPGRRAGRRTAVARRRPRPDPAQGRDAPSRSGRRLGRTPPLRGPGRSVPRRPSTKATRDRAVWYRARRRRCNAPRRCRSCRFPRGWPSRRASRCCRSGSSTVPRPDSPPSSVTPR